MLSAQPQFATLILNGCAKPECCASGGFVQSFPQPILVSKRIILLVENDNNDALLVRRALRDAAVLDEVIHLPDGEDAIAYLNGDVPYSDRDQYPLPILVLLDLKMPKLTGFDVLAWLQTHSELGTTIPVIVLTGSHDPDDPLKAKSLGAVGYEVKPIAFSELVNIARRAVTRHSGGTVNAGIQ
jgi:DNA-binding response OmpR family regulator